VAAHCGLKNINCVELQEYKKDANVWKEIDGVGNCHLLFSAEDRSLEVQLTLQILNLGVLRSLPCLRIICGIDREEVDQAMRLGRMTKAILINTYADAVYFQEKGETIRGFAWDA
jgi:hypothetical protein